MHEVTLVLAPEKMPTLYTPTFASFSCLAVVNVLFATVLLNVLSVVGTPSVKNTTYLIALVRVSLSKVDLALLKPAAVLVAPSGFKLSTPFFSVVTSDVSSLSVDADSAKLTNETCTLLAAFAIVLFCVSTPFKKVVTAAFSAAERTTLSPPHGSRKED